jgi:vacuolar protein sorting-associated protein 13A/C
MGSFNIIGNPYGLALNILKGVHALFDKPMTGFVKGPIEGSIGIFMGVGALVKHSVSGMMNSIESVSDSLGNGISHISLDPVYVGQRNFIK